MRRDGSLTELLDAAAAQVESEAEAATKAAIEDKESWSQSKREYKEQKRRLQQALDSGQECAAVCVQWANGGEVALSSARCAGSHS